MIYKTILHLTNENCQNSSMRLGELLRARQSWRFFGGGGGGDTVRSVNTSSSPTVVLAYRSITCR